jgi:hypothetical protein
MLSIRRAKHLGLGVSQPQNTENEALLYHGNSSGTPLRLAEDLFLRGTVQEIPALEDFEPYQSVGR